MKQLQGALVPSEKHRGAGESLEQVNNFIEFQTTGCKAHSVKDANDKLDRKTLMLNICL